MLRIMTTKGYRYLSLLRVKTLSQPRAERLEDWEFVVCYAPLLGGAYVRVNRLISEGGEMQTVRGPMQAEDLEFSVSHGAMPCGIAITYTWRAGDGDVVKQAISAEVEGAKLDGLKADVLPALLKPPHKH